MEPGPTTSAGRMSLASRHSHDVLNVIDIAKMLERRGVIRDYVRLLRPSNLAFQMWLLDEHGRIIWDNAVDIYRWIVQFSLYSPWIPLDGGPSSWKTSTATVNFYFKRDTSDRWPSSLWIVTSDRPMGLFSDHGWTKVFQRAVDSVPGDSLRNFRGLSPDEEILMFACDIGSYAWRGTLAELAHDVETVKEFADQNDLLFDMEQMHRRLYQVEKRLAEVSRALSGNQFVIRSFHDLVMESQLFSQHPLSARHRGSRAVGDHGTSDDADSRRILIREFQRAAIFLEASIGSVERLTQDLTSTRDFILRSASLNQGKRMEWVTTEALKVSFVMQSFTQVLGFAVLLLLPPIFISTFLGSSIFLFDVQAQDPSFPTWQISHQGLTLWLSLALPITAVFLVILYFIYWRSSGIRNPVIMYMAALRDLLRSPFGKARVAREAKEAVPA